MSTSGSVAPGKRTLSEQMPEAQPAIAGNARGTRPAMSAPGGPPGPAAARPTEGLGGGPSTGPDPTLDPTHDADRNTLTATGTASTGRNPQVDGRPVDPDHADGWGSAYGNCHGVLAFKNVEPDATERARIAGLHDGGQAGADQFGLTVPFRGALAYQCVEFVTRYYRDALGHGGLGGGNANSFLQGPRGGLEVHRFGTPAEPQAADRTAPQAGDLMVQEHGLSPVGHVGIVESVSGTPGGPVTGTIVQQNWGRSSPVTSFTATPRKHIDRLDAGIFQQVDVYDADHDWSGFRRKPGTAPVAARGGTSKSLWLGGVPDHGEGNYFVQGGQTVYLSDVARIYGLSVDQLRAFNPCIGDAVTAPGSGRIEIRVTAFTPPEPVIGTATIGKSGASIRTGPSTSSPYATGNHSLTAGRTVQVYQVVDGTTAVSGFDSRQWYRVAMYSGETAYVFKGLCSDGP